ncbi:hypothetical protein EI94DRAFT_1726722 [Lactarius quietus]|nr:hypothetical protein EI94DRAFT_1726722 [Lactarius quietus]
MDEKFRDARSEKAELEEYQSATQQQVARQFTPEAGPSSPPPYAPPPSAPPLSSPPPSSPPPSSSVVPTIPSNGLNISTMFENIRGVWLLDPLAPQSADRSILRIILQTLIDRRAGRRPRRFHNMTMGAPTAKLDSQRGNIFATFQVVGESAVPATATIRSTTHNGNIVLELVSKAPSRIINHDPNLLPPISRWGLCLFHFGLLFLIIRYRVKALVLTFLCPYARVERANNNETIVVIGSIAPPTPGFPGW